MRHSIRTPVQSVLGASFPHLRIPSGKTRGAHVRRDYRNGSSCRAKENIEVTSGPCPRPETNHRTRDAPVPSKQGHAGDRLRSLRTLEEPPQASIASHPSGETKKECYRACTAPRT